MLSENSNPLLLNHISMVGALVKMLLGYFIILFVEPIIFTNMD